jgi:type IV secretory pathway VirB4 component
MTDQAAPEPLNAISTEASIEEFLAIKAWTEKEIKSRLDRWKEENLFVASLRAELDAAKRLALMNELDARELAALESKA